jgi:hypothetical protein
MKMKYREVPAFEEVEGVAKTLEATTGTIDRKAVGRALLTTQAGFAGKKHEIVDGDGVNLRTVASFGGACAPVSQSCMCGPGNVSVSWFSSSRLRSVRCSGTSYAPRGRPSLRSAGSVTRNMPWRPYQLFRAVRPIRWSG